MTLVISGCFLNKWVVPSAAKPRPRGTGRQACERPGRTSRRVATFPGHRSTSRTYVARAAGTTGRDGLCIETPLFVLDRRVATLGDGTRFRSRRMESGGRTLRLKRQVI